ncbi:hypothetical protein P691DRAFT_765617 [Macrolepiota fuliginosa MF-IS2]|uniref:F-box domain-containing protein n=1 Tax=Macrolepiota fuliginosa MF-IS2 TaxID=1400762 RepID=A0A9P5X2A1_9AGAR|nr:hypothetical protein P691DRAFT_765617 [Macrolepiota fuliginosa MF-IS2]
MGLPTEEECKFIELTITHIEDEIIALHLKKALLCRRLNASRARTKVLPPEILTKIFEDVGGRWKKNRRVGGVCFYWRQVLMAFPPFWTCISLNCAAETAPNLLRLHLQNTRGAPLSIELVSQGYYDDPPATDISDILSSVDCSSRIRVLNIHTVNPHIWRCLMLCTKIGSNFPKLEELVLSFL